MIKISELKRLDKISLAEVVKIIDDYEDLRLEVTVEFQSFCKRNKLSETDTESYKKFCREFVNWYIRDERKEKYLSVLEQMKNENCGGVNNV